MYLLQVHECIYEARQSLPEVPTDLIGIAPINSLVSRSSDIAGILFGNDMR